jgi:hypothetical protein
MSDLMEQSLFEKLIVVETKNSSAFVESIESTLDHESLPLGSILRQINLLQILSIVL